LKLSEAIFGGMATIRRFEDLEVWKRARQLNFNLTPILSALQELKDYDLKSQLSRSAGSVMDNIAEGFERSGTREFIQFLAVSKGSLGEVRSQLYRVLDRGIIEHSQFEKMQLECQELSAKLASFMNYLNNSEIKGTKFKTPSIKDQ
jgi:four helix bundle protein